MLIEQPPLLIAQGLHARQDHVRHQGVIQQVIVVEQEVVEFQDEPENEFSILLKCRQSVHNFGHLKILHERDDLEDLLILGGVEVIGERVEGERSIIG